MGDINLERDELEAIAATDKEEVRRLVRQCLDEERIQPMLSLQLESCGLFVAERQRDYEKALAEYNKAKSPKKRDDTYGHALKAGSNLEFALNAMKQRAEEQEQESRLFVAHDHIIPPGNFTENLSVSVSYKWREVKEDDWTFSFINFLHEAHRPIDYLAPKTKRKPPAWKVEQERQDRLYQQWEHLMRSGLQSLKKFFQDGGKASVVPRYFKAKTGSSGELDNFSTDFWR